MEFSDLCFELFELALEADLGGGVDRAFPGLEGGLVVGLEGLDLVLEAGLLGVGYGRSRVVLSADVVTVDIDGTGVDLANRGVEGVVDAGGFSGRHSG